MRSILGGIGAGVMAGALMLALLMLSSVAQRHVWWMTPNVLGSTFYSGRGLRAGLGFVTLSGVALHLLLSGLIGGVFGVVSLRVWKTRRYALLALFVTMVWYFLAYRVIWARVNPLVPLYASEPSTGIAHVLFALAMGRSLRVLVGSPVLTVEMPPMLPFPSVASPTGPPALPEPVSSQTDGARENQTAPGGPIQIE